MARILLYRPLSHQVLFVYANMYICSEIKKTIHETFQNSWEGIAKIMHFTRYSRILKKVLLNEWSSWEVPEFLGRYYQWITFKRDDSWHKWVEPSENVPSNMRKMHRFWVHPTHAQNVIRASAFHWYMIHSMVFNDSASGQRRPWSDCADAQADLGLRCSHMPEDTLSHGAVHVLK